MLDDFLDDLYPLTEAQVFKLAMILAELSKDPVTGEYKSLFPETEDDDLSEPALSREKERELFVKVCGEEYARKMGLFDD